MTEAIEFVREVGFPIALAIALCYTLYLIGKTGLALLLEAWKQKDLRLAELEQRINAVNNGQRTALEQRYDAGLDAQRQTAQSLDKVSGCLSKLGEAFELFAESRPCLRDSDAMKIVDEAEAEFTPDPDALKVVQRRKDRQEKKQ